MTASCRYASSGMSPINPARIRSARSMVTRGPTAVAALPPTRPSRVSPANSAASTAPIASAIRS